MQDFSEWRFLSAAGALVKTRDAGTGGAAVQEADYVIVGAGSSGCVVANRLSADGKRRVLVLEAGGSDLNPWVRMPISTGAS